MVSRGTFARFTERISRLYEQCADYLRIGEYVEHRFTWIGLIRKIVLKFSHRPKSLIFVRNMAVGVYWVVPGVGAPFHLYWIRGFPPQSFIPPLTVIESPSYNWILVSSSNLRDPKSSMRADKFLFVSSTTVNASRRRSRDTFSFDSAVLRIPPKSWRSSWVTSSGNIVIV